MNPVAPAEKSACSSPRPTGAYQSIRRAIALLDPALDLDAKGEHVIHPIGFLGTLEQS